MDNFTYCNDFVMQFDGYKNDAAPGEKFKTSYGVTQYTWYTAVQHGIVSGSIDDCTFADACSILRVLFWNAANCPQMPPGADLMIYANAVASGVGHSVKLAQRIVGVEQDGVAGPKTRLAIVGFGIPAFISAMGKADEAFYATLPNAPTFLRGWDRREALAMQAALKLAGMAPAPATLTAEGCPAPTALPAAAPGESLLGEP